MHFIHIIFCEFMASRKSVSIYYEETCLKKLFFTLTFFFFFDYKKQKIEKMINALKSTLKKQKLLLRYG